MNVHLDMASPLMMTGGRIDTKALAEHKGEK